VPQPGLGPWPSLRRWIHHRRCDRSDVVRHGLDDRDAATLACPPESSTRRPWALGLRLPLSSAIHLGWGLGLLIIFPALAYPRTPTLLIVPDLGYLILTSSMVALGWGITRPPLTYFTLRQRDG
jgi:hypothetical protein